MSKYLTAQTFAKKYFTKSNCAQSLQLSPATNEAEYNTDYRAGTADAGRYADCNGGCI